MTYMTSKASSNGDVEINVYFKQGSDPDMATVNVQNRVARAQALLPADVNKVGVKVEKRQNNILRIFAVRSSDGKYDEDFVSNYIDINVKPKLMRVTGVGNVQSLGNTYALRIWLKPDVMAQYGLTPNDIFAAIGGQSFVAGVGSLGEQSENAYQYSMQYKGTLKTIDEFNNIVLRTKDGGHLLHLNDVADVKIGAMSYNFTSNIQDKPGALCMVFAAPGANATQVNASINKTFEEIKPTMPAGLEFVTLMTSDDFLFAAIHNDPCGVLLPAELQGNDYSFYINYRFAVGNLCRRVTMRLLAEHPYAVRTRAGYRYGGGRRYCGGRGCDG